MHELDRALCCSSWKCIECMVCFWRLWVFTFSLCLCNCLPLHGPDPPQWVYVLSQNQWRYFCCCVLVLCLRFSGGTQSWLKFVLFSPFLISLVADPSFPLYLIVSCGKFLSFQGFLIYCLNFILLSIRSCFIYFFRFAWTMKVYQIIFYKKSVASLFKCPQLPHFSCHNTHLQTWLQTHTSVSYLLYLALVWISSLNRRLCRTKLKSEWQIFSFRITKIILDGCLDGISFNSWKCLFCKDSSLCFLFHPTLFIWLMWTPLFSDVQLILTMFCKYM